MTSPTTPDKPNPDSTSKPEDKGDKKETLLTKKDDAAPGAPEKYEDFKTPDGVSLNPEVITEAQGMFKEWGLTQDQAQKAVDFYVKNATNEANAVAKVYDDLRTEWQTKTKSDPEIGSKLPEVKRDVSKALDAALGAQGAAAFKQALDDTGAGDHPDVIKALYKLSPRWIEGSHVSGKGPAPVTAPNSKPKSAGAALWPNLPSANG